MRNGIPMPLPLQTVASWDIVQHVSLSVKTTLGMWLMKTTIEFYPETVRSGTPITIGYGGHCVMVTDNGDMYSYDDDNTQVTIRTVNSTSSSPVMIISDRCDDLYVTTNNTLYCSAGWMDQVVTKSLNDPTNTLSVVAGTGCHGSGPDSFAHPVGIFVTLNLSLYVADSENNRIQRFHSGETNATTVAGDGAPSTITLNYPADVVLDGDGYLFIVEFNSHRIVGSGPNGFRCVAGCTGGSGSASNQLTHPQSMSFDSDGNIWVADTDNSRIQKFSRKTASSGKSCLLVHNKADAILSLSSFFHHLRLEQLIHRSK